ncbi:hypothetical protein KNW02_09375 [Paracoccus sp. XHP0099]|uniref:Uncharacterized protein n=2 Tax=Paracoccus marinaquae TaxID=2841926 RepID=A0ABS6AIB0_9RHOB|nr:hypothetical protein [Paracoccus marinaquae]
MRADALERGGGTPAPELRDEAADLHRSLGRFLQLADAHLVRRGEAAGTQDLPLGTDWHWRPLIVRGRIRPGAAVAPQNGQHLGDEVALYHDCPHQALILRQVPNRRAADLAPYALTLEMMGFSGSYLSLALALPADLNPDLGRHHVIRLDATLHSERSIVVYGRLNIAQGPNTETILRQLGHPIDGRECRRTVEFDLGFAELSQRPVDKVWLDLIFEAPRMNAVTVTEAMLSRHPRAEM